jgi:hypothetical protein
MSCYLCPVPCALCHLLCALRRVRCLVPFALCPVPCVCPTTIYFSVHCVCTMPGGCPLYAILPCALCPDSCVLCPAPSLCAVPCALCPVPYALCPVHCVLCLLPCAPCTLCPVSFECVTCPVPYALPCLCPMLSVLCPFCPLPFALCSMPFALFPVPFALYSGDLCSVSALVPVPFALCPAFGEVYPMPCALCPMSCALCHMPCALCNLPCALYPLPLPCVIHTAAQLRAREGLRRATLPLSGARSWDGSCRKAPPCPPLLSRISHRKNVLPRAPALETPAPPRQPKICKSRSAECQVCNCDQMKARGRLLSSRKGYRKRIMSELRDKWIWSGWSCHAYCIFDGRKTRNLSQFEKMPITDWRSCDNEALLKWAILLNN